MKFILDKESGCFNLNGVNLCRPIPECLKGKASLNMEMVPVHVVGKSWIMDEQQRMTENSDV